MGTPFSKLYKNLLAWVDGVPPSFAKLIVQQSIREIYDEHDWGFLVQNSFIRTPQLIGGFAKVTQFSNIVRLDATSRAFVNALTADDVPITERQFRTLSPVAQTGKSFVYNIVDYSSSGGASASGSIQVTNPVDGDFVVVNGISFVFRDSPIEATDVQIDVNPINTNGALIAAIGTYADPLNTVASYVGIGTNTTTITYLTEGVIGNTFTLETNDIGNIILSGATLTGGIDDAQGLLTIDPPYQDVSNDNGNFQILKMYYAPPWFTPVGGDPVIDFKGWEFVISPLWQRRVWLDSTQEELNRFDPVRIWVDEPRHLVPFSYETDTEGNEIPKFEFYPAPNRERVFRVQYRRLGVIPKLDNEIIPFFNPELILKKARIKAYEWLIANSDKSVQVKTTGKYQNLIAMLMNPNANDSYPRLLEKAISLDTDVMNRSFMGDFLNGNDADGIYCDRGFNGDRISSTLVLSF